ncbi:hypothetical protein ACFSFZ_09845 [Mixta tenebrionis]|uniref:Glycosyl transferase n=1 Tax=Mixta tenebrionis TaxID=2562439 RepID=A0A506V9T7_9GAMM|nr:hypothetical protein [Mixta tenebrionis]TPW42704.1 hypothetical protein FKM52_07975 [Mixta tenebrionis]
MKYFDIIRQSIDNEIAIDDFLIKKFGLNSKKKAVFKVARFRDKIPAFVCYLYLPLLPVYFIFIIIFMLKGIFKKDSIAGEKVFFSFSSSPKVKKLYKENVSDVFYFQCVDGRKINFIYQMSLYDILIGFMKSIYFSYLLLFRLKGGYYLHLTSVLELTLFCYFLKRLHSQGIREIFLTNHYDRWVTATSLTELFDINIIQHGILDRDFRVPNKLKRIKKIICFNSEQLHIFNTNIFEFKVREFDYSVFNLDIAEDDTCDVLIISNPFYLEKELEFYKNLSNEGMVVFFRPHPLFIDDSIYSLVDERNICLNKRFPNPKLCLCRDSTLGHEYESLGFRVFWWDEKLDIRAIIRTVSK